MSRGVGHEMPVSSIASRCAAVGATIHVLRAGRPETAGFPGGVVASLALFVPFSLLAYGATLAWARHHQQPWHGTAERDS